MVNIPKKNCRCAAKFNKPPGGLLEALRYVSWELVSKGIKSIADDKKETFQLSQDKLKIREKKILQLRRQF